MHFPKKKLIPTSHFPNFQARSKLPKKRRRVLPVEQPRRKRDMEPPANRRVTALKHNANPPTIFKDAFGGAKIGKRHL